MNGNAWRQLSSREICDACMASRHHFIPIGVPDPRAASGQDDVRAISLQGAVEGLQGAVDTSSSAIAAPGSRCPIPQGLQLWGEPWIIYILGMLLI